MGFHRNWKQKWFVEAFDPRVFSHNRLTVGIEADAEGLLFDAVQAMCIRDAFLEPMKVAKKAGKAPPLQGKG